MNIKKLILVVILPIFLSALAAPLFASAQTIVDGDLIRAESTFDIFIVKIISAKKFKRLILNPTIFESYGHLKWGDVKDVQQSTVDQYTASNLAIEVNADGSVADPRVYAINSSLNSDVGERRHLNVNAPDFETAGLDWDSIYKINHTEASPNFYPTKTPLTKTDNLLTWATNVNVTIIVQTQSQLSINGVTPNQLESTEPTYISIAGTNFKSGATVKIGTSALATNVNVINSTIISAIAPAGLTAGIYNVIVINPDGNSATLPNAITITTPTILSITSVSPNQILNNIDNYLTIGGTNFQTGSQVIIGSQYATVTFISSTALSVKVSSGLTAGTYSVQVRNPDGTSSILSNVLTVLNPPIITPTTTELTTSEIFVKIAPTVVQIKNDKDIGCPCLGSGMIIDSDGYILTNEHVIKNDDVVEVKLNNGTILNGTVIGWNEARDLAVVKIGGNGSYVSFGNSDLMQQGEKVVVLGHPLGLPSVVISEGILTAKQQTEGGLLLQSNASTQPGSSGGPWVDKEGKVIGVHLAGIGPRIYGIKIDIGYNFAIPINEAKSILNDLKSGVKTSKPDTIASTISNIQAINITMNSATITWTTNEPATSKVDYGPTTAYSLTSSSGALVTNHSISFTNLLSGTTYYYRVSSKDNSGNESTSLGYSFTTTVLVNPGSLTATVKTPPISQSVVRDGTSSITFVNFLFTAGASEDVRITSIKLTADGDISNSNTTDLTASQLQADITEVYLYDGTTLVAGPKTIDSNKNVIFTGLAMTAPKGGQKEITVKAIIKSTAVEDHRVWFKIDAGLNVTATGLSTNADITLSNTLNIIPSVYMTIKDSGSLYANLTSGTLPATIIVAGKTASFTSIDLFAKDAFGADSSEDIVVSALRVTANTATILDAANDNIKTVYVYKGATLLGSALWDTVNGSVDVPFTTNLPVAKGAKETIVIKADLNSIAEGADSGDTPQLGISYNIQTGMWTSDYANKYNIVARGVPSNKNVYVGTSSGNPSANLLGNTMTVRKTLPTINYVSSGTNLQTIPGLGEVLRFSITADSGGDVIIDALTFKMTSTDVATANQWNEYKDATNGGQMELSDFTLYDASSLTILLESSDNDWTFLNSSGVVYPSSAGDGDIVYFVSLDFANNIIIHAGQTKTFVLHVDTTGAKKQTGVSDAVRFDVIGDVSGTYTDSTRTNAKYFKWDDGTSVSGGISGQYIKNFPSHGATIQY